MEKKCENCGKTIPLKKYKDLTTGEEHEIVYRTRKYCSTRCRLEVNLKRTIINVKKDARLTVSKENKDKFMKLKYVLNQNVGGKSHTANDVITHMFKMLDEFTKLRKEHYRLKNIVGKEE